MNSARLWCLIWLQLLWYQFAHLPSSSLRCTSGIVHAHCRPIPLQDSHHSQVSHFSDDNAKPVECSHLSQTTSWSCWLRCMPCNMSTSLVVSTDCWLRFNYSEDLINGTPFVQCLVSHLHENPTYKLHFVWYCEFWFHQDRPNYIRIPFTYCPTYRVLTVRQMWAWPLFSWPALSNCLDALYFLYIECLLVHRMFTELY